jgi:hypothetical protein
MVNKDSLTFGPIQAKRKVWLSATTVERMLTEMAWRT